MLRFGVFCGQVEQRTSGRVGNGTQRVGGKPECVMRVKSRKKFKKHRGVHCEKFCWVQITKGGEKGMNPKMYVRGVFHDKTSDGLDVVHRSRVFPSLSSSISLLLLCLPFTSTSLPFTSLPPSHFWFIISQKQSTKRYTFLISYSFRIANFSLILPPLHNIADKMQVRVIFQKSPAAFLCLELT